MSERRWVRRAPLVERNQKTVRFERVGNEERYYWSNGRPKAVLTVDAQNRVVRGKYWTSQHTHEFPIARFEQEEVHQLRTEWGFIYDNYGVTARTPALEI